MTTPAPITWPELMALGAIAEAAGFPRHAARCYELAHHLAPKETPHADQDQQEVPGP